MEVINYNKSIVSVSNSIMKYFDVKPYHNTLKELDDVLTRKNYQNVVLLVADGLGSENLKLLLTKDKFLRTKQIMNLTTVFPPTTTSATTSLLTGLYPSEHNWYGWDMYFKDTNETISLYLNKLKGTSKAPRVKVLDRSYMQFTSLVDLINNNKTYKAYYAYPFSLDNPCKSFQEVSARIKELCSIPSKKFIYAYIEEPDKSMHKYGINSLKVKNLLLNLNNQIEKLANELTNTLIILLADHGLISTKYINLKTDYKEIYDMLERQTTIETRAVGIKLKENVLKEDFEKLFKKYLQTSFTLLSKEQVLKLNLFGFNHNKYLEDTIGDYLLVATQNISLNYDDTSPIFKANHGGYTKEELEVPLIIIDTLR